MIATNWCDWMQRKIGFCQYIIIVFYKYRAKHVTNTTFLSVW